MDFKNALTDDVQKQIIRAVEGQCRADAAQSASMTTMQPIAQKQDLRNIWIDKNTTITIDLEEMKRELEKSHFPQLFEFGA